MFGVRGRRRPIAFPPAVGRGPAEGGQMPLPRTTAAVPELIMARVTVVMDPTSFWAQVGKEETLAEFDQTMAALSRWCEENGTRATSLPLVNELVCVKGAGSGEWLRARVSRQVSESVIEVLYVDTGASRRVPLSNVCRSVAPQLCTVPCQALQCSLSGAQPVGAGEVWSDEAIARFSDLVTGVPVKADIVSAQAMGLVLQLHVRRGEEWTDVLGLLVSEGFAVDEFAEHRVTSEPVSSVANLEEEKAGDEEDDRGSCTYPAAEVELQEKVVGLAVEGEEGTVGLAMESGGTEEVTVGDEEEERVAGIQEEISMAQTVELVTSKGPLVVKGMVEQEEEEEEGRDGESTSPAASDDDEWDDSLLDQSLDPLRDSTEDPFTLDPFAPPEPDRQRHTKLMAHFTALVGAANEVCGGGGRGRGEWGRGGRRGGGRRGGLHHHQSQQGGGRQGVEWRWREQGRGVRQKRGAGRTNHRSSHEEENEGSQGPQEPMSSSPGGMRGVRVFAKESRETERETNQKTAPPKPTERPLALSPVPPSTRPVQLFPKEGVAKTLGTARPPQAGGEPTEGGRGIREMNRDTASKEVEWHYWKLGNHMEKVLAELAPENAESFGNEVQSILSAHSSAQKLMSIPGSLGPVWPVLNCVLKEGAKRKDDTQKTVVVAVRSLAAVLCVDVCQLLQPAVNEMAEDVCRPSFTDQSKQAKRMFCGFIGKLFLDAGYSVNNDYAMAVGKIVRGFLNTWSKCPEKKNEGQLLAEVQCFGQLCRQIGPTLDVTNRETLEQYFNGIVKKNILTIQLAESVRSCLLDLALERAAGWRNEEEEERGCKVRPYAQSTPTPAAFSQDTPTHSVNGQRVIQPVPVSSAGKAPTTPSTPATHHLQQISHQSPATPYTQPHPSMLSSSSLSLLHSSHNLPQSQTSLPPTSGTPTPFQAGLHHHVTLPPLTANQQANNVHVEASFTEVETMLHVLGLCHLTDCFKNAMFNDSLINVGNMEFLRSGLKDAGLHPGEVVAVLDYLERRQRPRQTTEPPSPPSPHSSSTSSGAPHDQHPSVSRHHSLPNHSGGTVHTQQQFPISRQSSYPDIHPYSPSGLPNTPHYSPSNPQPQSFCHSNPQLQPFGPSNPQPQSYVPNNPQPQSFGPSNPQSQSFGPSNPQPQSFRPQSCTPQSPAASVSFPHQSSHIHYPHVPVDSYDLAAVPQQRYRPPSNYPSTPRPSSLTPTPHPSSLPTQSSFPPPSARGYSQNEPPSSPALSATPVGRVETPLPGSPAPVRKYGFGQYSCVLCRSKEHFTSQCPDRHHLLLQSTALY